MIQFHDFGIDVQTYAERGKENDFPLLKKCPHCRAKRPLHRHGYDERNALTPHGDDRIWIVRYRCRECLKTVSVLPSFLLPYFQYTLSAIWQVVKEQLGLTEGTNRAPFLLTKDGIIFYVRRFYRNLSSLHSFFARRWRIIGPIVKKEKERASWWIRTLEKHGLDSVIRDMWEDGFRHPFANQMGS
ncbi:transposase [Geobacillus lituanicus]|nr:transposase [Geobacillus lituanicus]